MGASPSSAARRRVPARLTPNAPRPRARRPIPHRSRVDIDVDIDAVLVVVIVVIVVVTVSRERPEEADKWKDTVIVHVGEGSRERVRLGVCIGEFHNKLMDRMLEDARVSAEAMGSTIDKVVWVPGTYEAPLVVENMLQDPTLDACVVIGYIEKGSTLHGQEMGATFSIIGKQLELEYGKPVGMGIIGPGATAEQADQRVAYAGNAVRAAIRMARTFVPAEES